MSEKKNTSRRKFLKSGLIAGAATLAGGSFLTVLAKSEAKAESESGNAVTLLTTDGQLMQVDSTNAKPLVKPIELKSNQKRGREGIKGKKWVMVIDLSKCRNAQKCMNACRTAHHLKPEQHHTNTLRMQDAEHTQPYFMPKPCFHCDNPPCTKICPVDATFKRQDGLVLIDNERCIGCRFCMAACPYSARVFNWLEPKKVEGDENLAYDVELNVPQKKGTISKCLFSADRLRKGELPYCVSACPNSVYYFGDMNEDAVTNGTTKETVKFSQLIRENAGYTYLEELGTKPSVYYLPAKNRVFPFEFEGKTSLNETKE